ncbi:hypothetical protein EMCRGX_G002640 [Ephydatia muelleri]
MVFFAVVLLLDINTVASALTERQVSALADIREGVALLGNVANESRSLMVKYLNNETSGVLFAVCLLRNYTWSRNTLSQLDYDALIAVKDAVINNSCSWLSSLGQSISCDQLSDYCYTTEWGISVDVAHQLTHRLGFLHAALDCEYLVDLLEALRG